MVQSAQQPIRRSPARRRQVTPSSVVVGIRHLQWRHGRKHTTPRRSLPPRDRKCAPGRFIGADYAYDPPNPRHMTAQRLEEFHRPEHWRSLEVTRPVAEGEFEISPKFMRPGETLVLEFRLGNAAGGWEPGWRSRAVLCGLAHSWMREGATRSRPRRWREAEGDVPAGRPRSRGNSLFRGRPQDMSGDGLSR